MAKPWPERPVSDSEQERETTGDVAGGSANTRIGLVQHLGDTARLV